MTLGLPGELVSPSVVQRYKDLARSPAPRDLAFERTWTVQMGESVRVNVDELVIFAEGRAGDGPVRDLLSRDFGLEIREELADARNYLVWQLMQADQAEEPDGELIEVVRRCLASVAEAFDLARRIRRGTVGA